MLRFYCDLNVDQCAEILGCSPGTVKSQTARALEAVRRALGPAPAAGSGGQSAAAVDHDAVLDLLAAVAALPPRQRATLVLRYYCDLNVDQAAEVLGCSPGTVKSQTAKALGAVRRALGPAPAAGAGGQPATAEHQIYQEAPGHD